MYRRLATGFWVAIGAFTATAFVGLLMKPVRSDAQPMISTADQVDRRTGGASSVLDPFKIPKYQIPLVIPGVMKHN